MRRDGHAIAALARSQPGLIESPAGDSEFCEPDCSAEMSAILGRCGKCPGCLAREEANLLELTGMTMTDVRAAVAELRAHNVPPVEGRYAVKCRKGGVLTVRADL